MKKIKHLTDYCLGCGICSIYCSAAHADPELDLIKAFKVLIPPPPGVIVEKGEGYALAVSCQHCPEPPCTMSCITGALTRDPATGVVSIDPDRCVGCWTCVAACPYGIITIDENRPARPRANKCDLCAGVSEVPICVLKCPNEARILVEEDGQ
ncbi:MAG: 4Fe-4S dicluster domain-containing protein [Syntrophomonadaceae bacterium]|nr:4Fe-4S dicluster domain-containing protein [Syntrophomonadaceae bacterium]